MGGDEEGRGEVRVGVNSCASVGGVCIGGSWPRGSVSIWKI